MKIAIDATGLGAAKTGTGVYLVEILKAWNRDPAVRHDFVIFCSPKTSGYLRQLDLDCRFRYVAAPDSRLLRVLWQQLVLPWRLRREGADVHWGVGFVLPALAAMPMVVTVYDLTFQLFPQVHERLKRFYFPAMIARAVGKAAAVIAISETTRRDLERLLPASRGKTAVTLLAARAVPPQAARPVARAEEPYLLFVGTVEPRKNLQRLIEAWLALEPGLRSTCRLVVVGAKGWLIGDALTRDLPDNGNVIFKGYVPDDVFEELMARAMAFVYPSLYEGFGLPVIEAMARGVPVITSDVGATREVAGSAALLVDPESVTSISAALAMVLRDGPLRQRLARDGMARAREFSWQKTAAETLAVLEGAWRGSRAL